MSAVRLTLAVFLFPAVCTAWAHGVAWWHILGEVAPACLRHLGSWLGVIGFLAGEWAALRDGVFAARFDAMLMQARWCVRQQARLRFLPPRCWSVLRILRRHDRNPTLPFVTPRGRRLATCSSLSIPRPPGIAPGVSRAFQAVFRAGGLIHRLLRMPQAVLLPAPAA